MYKFNRRRFLKLLGQGTAALGMGISLGTGAACAKEETGTKAESGRQKASVKYQVFYPGEYLDFEKAAVEERAAIAKRGPQKGDRKPQVVNEADLLQYNRTWDPYNPLFNEKDYAQKAGYPGVPAFPCFMNPRGSDVPQMPWEIYGTYYFANDGGDTQVWTPIFAGDSFTTEGEKIVFEDLTVPGSDLRCYMRGSSGKMYNAKGEQVGWGYSAVRHAHKKVIEGPQPTFSESYAHWVEEFFANRPGHYTTDEEWDYIRELWDKEYIRGSQKLYWEDVQVGDEPTWTCSGPIGHMDIVGWNGGGQRGIYLRDNWDRHKDLFKDRYGIYLPNTAMHYGGRNIPGARMVFYNNTAAMHITRMVTNYIGDAGLVTRIHWRFKQVSKHMWDERFESGEYLDKVPYMKGRRLDVHGTEGDTVIAKGYVTDKYINDRGEHTIDLTCWGETLDNKIIQIVAASAKLPSMEG